MKAFKTKIELKQTLAEVKGCIEGFEIFEPKTTNRIMKILEADACYRYWKLKRDELMLAEYHINKPNSEPEKH